MSSCCAATSSSGNPGSTRQCLECGRTGRAVEAITLKALLRPDVLARLRPIAYRFCPTPTCPVVYFASEAESVYHTDDVKVRVGLKEVEDPIPVCYCFGHTRASIWEGIQRTGKPTVVGTITAHVRAGRCACEVNNPGGTCCLGEVSKTVKEGLAWFARRADEHTPALADDRCRGTDSPADTTEGGAG